LVISGESKVKIETNVFQK